MPVPDQGHGRDLVAECSLNDSIIDRIPATSKIGICQSSSALNLFDFQEILSRAEELL